MVLNVPDAPDPLTEAYIVDGEPPSTASERTSNSIVGSIGGGIICHVALASDETKIPLGAATSPLAPAYSICGLLGAATNALTYRLASPVAVIVQLVPAVPVSNPAP